LTFTISASDERQQYLLHSFEFFCPRIDQFEVAGAFEWYQFGVVSPSDGCGNVLPANFERHTGIVRSMHQFLGDSERKQLDRRSDAVAIRNFLRTAAEEISHNPVAQAQLPGLSQIGHARERNDSS